MTITPSFVNFSLLAPFLSSKNLQKKVKISGKKEHGHIKGALSLGGDILKNERLCFLREQLSNKKSLKNNFVYFDSTHSSGPFRMEISP